MTNQQDSTRFKNPATVHTPLMKHNPKTIIRKPNGETQIDPAGHNYRVQKWFEKATNKDGSINYDYFYPRISRTASHYAVKIVFDMRDGKNTAKGSRRGPRAPSVICQYKDRVPYIVELCERILKKEFVDFTEDDILTIFNGMREGRILAQSGKPYRDMRTYAKLFGAFWRYYVRVKKKEEGVRIEDICCSIDTTNHTKPPWNYFTLDDVKKMVEVAPSSYYRAFLLLLFDAGVRAPKELMNIRAKDLTPIPNSDNLFLQVRDDTSKTFGRKIKLMISSSAVKEYLRISKKKGDDYLFDKRYQSMTRMLKQLCYQALGRGSFKVGKRGCKKYTAPISMYDFRHSSVCHYLPLYQSENQMKYRYGWKKADMIHYYSEFMGMTDNITDADLLTDTTKSEIETELMKEKQKVAMLQEQMQQQQKEISEKMKQLERMMVGKFSHDH